MTSYALLRLDAESYLAQPWSGVVLDEAQHVKNPAGKTYSVVRRLQAPFALAITGTPLENSLMDLWALLSIGAPRLFPDPQRFAEDYRRPIESGTAPEQLVALRRRLRPLVQRRTKEQGPRRAPRRSSRSSRSSSSRSTARCTTGTCSASGSGCSVCSTSCSVTASRCCAP